MRRTFTAIAICFVLLVSLAFAGSRPGARVNVGTSATLVAAADESRVGLIVTNDDAADDLYCAWGNASVTVSTGYIKIPAANSTRIFDQPAKTSPTSTVTTTFYCAAEGDGALALVETVKN